jgi:FtsZ-interacting cell division protein ZipA
MKIIIQLIAIAILLLAGLTTTNAQRGGGWEASPEVRAEEQTSRMKSDLGLTDEQAKKIKDINLKYAQKAQEKRKEKAAEKEKIRAEREAARAEHQKEVEKILTKEQQEKWVKIRQERPERKGPRGGAPRKGGNRERARY